ncbi:fluoride efflux transporter CrcB [Ammoniphilus resinae]|uniref:Fluoride-specific ion channel FluC n=1 Tax=Ammoniphilus resinae TaxID=861532 RepID=A0ABS4GRU9_9BACL|nr:fluoride efflux transporter CrcB [Ammoniphilus resinae]MBP1932752.1 CrcB protein [Ammoniphilus resinae]
MNILAVGIGGFFGAILRYTLGEWIHTTNGFPLGTLIINLLGCLLLAWFFTITTKKWQIHPPIKVGIGTGFVGAFTTFSTFSVETLNLINHHQMGLAILYVLVSVFGGLGFALVGAKLGGSE